MSRTTDRGWWVVPIALAAWLFGIAFAGVTWGVWAGIAVWLAPPALFGGIVLLSAAVRPDPADVKTSIARHPSSHEWVDPHDLEAGGKIVDIRGKR